MDKPDGNEPIVWFHSRRPCSIGTSGSLVTTRRIRHTMRAVRSISIPERIERSRPSPGPSDRSGRSGVRTAHTPSPRITCFSSIVALISRGFSTSTLTSRPASGWRSGIDSERSSGPASSVGGSTTTSTLGSVGRRRTSIGRADRSRSTSAYRSPVLTGTVGEQLSRQGQPIFASTRRRVGGSRGSPRWRTPTASHLRADSSTTAAAERLRPPRVSDRCLVRRSGRPTGGRLAGQTWRCSPITAAQPGFRCSRHRFRSARNSSFSKDTTSSPATRSPSRSSRRLIRFNWADSRYRFHPAAVYRTPTVFAAGSMSDHATGWSRDRL